MPPPRWIAIGVFAFYSGFNYLDRQILAALGPQIKIEFGLSNEDYGWLQSAFYLAYALCAPFVGLWIDRVGLTRGAILTIASWSLAGTASGFIAGFAGLLLCRVLLGVAQAGAIPAFGKASATYLEPRERALGSGVGQLGISLGSMSAPLVAGWVAAVSGWRTAFIVTGLAGFLWIPMWSVAEPRGMRSEPAKPAIAPPSPSEMMRDVRLWALAAGNMLIMSVYSLWTNWTTIFLVEQFPLTQAEANSHYAWIPPVMAIFGGLFGGWLAMKWMQAGATVMQARSRTILAATIAILVTLAAPYMPGPGWATAMVSLSFFWSVAASVNVYALPQDMFGPGRAAFGISTITFSFGLMLVFYSPLVGRLVDWFSFTPVCLLSAFLPLAGWLLIRIATSRTFEIHE
jgi:ACS family hexuronate transporter-like MFS transporter